MDSNLSLHRSWLMRISIWLIRQNRCDSSMDQLQLLRKSKRQLNANHWSKDKYWRTLWRNRRDLKLNLFLNLKRTVSLIIRTHIWTNLKILVLQITMHRSRTISIRDLLNQNLEVMQDATHCSQEIYQNRLTKTLHLIKFQHQVNTRQDRTKWQKTSRQETLMAFQKAIQ